MGESSSITSFEDMKRFGGLVEPPGQKRSRLNSLGGDQQPVKTADNPITSFEDMKRRQAALESRGPEVPTVAATKAEPTKQDLVGPRASNFFSSPQELRDRLMAIPEVADELITGLVTFFPHMISKLEVLLYAGAAGDDDTVAIEGAEQVSTDISKFVSLMLHGGMESGEVPPAAKESIGLMQKTFAWPREHGFKPLGNLYAKVTGSKLGGQVTADALEFFTYMALAPKIREMTRVRAAKRMREQWRGDVQEPSPPPREGKTRQGYYEDLSVEELFGEDAAEETVRAMEQRDLSEAASKIKARELAAQQRVYDQFFTEEHVREYMDDVERFADRKGKDEGAKVDKVDAEALYDAWVERLKKREPKLQKDWQNWQDKKNMLQARGIQPAVDVIDQLQREIGRPGKGLPPGKSDLKFGVEAERPYPEEPAGEQPTIVVPKQPRPKRDLRDPLASGKAEPVEETAPSKAAEQGDALMGLGQELVDQGVGEALETSEPAQPAQPAQPGRILPRMTMGDMTIMNEKMRVKDRAQRQKLAGEKTDKMLQEEPGEAAAEPAGEGPARAQQAELDALVKEQAADQAADQVTEHLSASEAQLQAARDMDEFVNEQQWEPDPDSVFYQSLMQDEPRPLSDLMRDWKDFFAEDWLDESGHFSTKKLTGEQRARAERLFKDIMVIRRNAARLGKKISDYLVEGGWADRATAEAIEKQAEDIVKEERQEIRYEGAGDAARVDRMFEKAEEAQRKRWRERFMDGLRKTGKAMVARDRAVRKTLENDPIPEAGDVLDSKILAAGGQPKGAHYFKAADKAIFSHLDRTERWALDRLVAARTEISIAARRKSYQHPDELSPKDYKTWLANAQSRMGLNDAQMRRVVQASDDLFNTYRDLLNMKYQEDAIPRWLYDMLVENEYSPSRWQHINDLYEYGLDRGKLDLHMKKPPASLEELRDMVSEPDGGFHTAATLGVRESGVKRLKGGSKGYKNMNQREMLSVAVGETYSWVMRNQATNSLGKYAEVKGLAGEIVRTAKVKETKVDKYGNEQTVYAKPPRGFRRIPYFKGGKKQELWAADWFADEWRNSSADIRQQYAGILRTASGSSLIRQMATGAGAPLFFTRGLFMDMLHIYMAAQKRMPDGSYRYVYSAKPPVFAGQALRDLATVVPDAILRRGRYLDSLDEGMHFNFLTETGGVSTGGPKARGKLRAGLKLLGDISSYMNTTAEVSTRLMVRERLLREGYTKKQASAAARDYLDFYQGGNLAKILDDMLPYTNVGIQALRTVGRAGKRDPAGFAERVAWMAGFAGTLTAYNMLRHPEATENVSQYTKNNFFTIGTDLTIDDVEGNKYHIGVKIRKDPTTAVVSTLAEIAMARAMGNEDRFKRALIGLKDVVPYLQGFPIPPYMKGAVTYVTNTDLLTLKKIWRGETEGVNEWYVGRTSALWDDLGKTLGLSPERFKAAAETVLTRNNIYVRMFEAGYDELFRELPKEHQQTLADEILLNYWANDALYVAREGNKFREDFEDIDIKHEAVRGAQNRRLDLWARKHYLEGDAEFNDVMNFITSQPIEDQPRLQKRLENFVTTMNMKNHSMWMSVGGAATPGAKAEKVVEWYRRSDEAKQREIMRGLGMLRGSRSSIIPKDLTTEFWREFGRLMYQKPASTSESKSERTSPGPQSAIEATKRKVASSGIPAEVKRIINEEVLANA